MGQRAENEARDAPSSQTRHLQRQARPHEEGGGGANKPPIAAERAYGFNAVPPVTVAS